jgi:DNA-binding transcriptional MerR regulator
MTYSIGELGKEFGLSRSTLLYYDKLGLLKPSGRSDANYRQYTERDHQRLAKIITYRDTGMSLQAIGELLSQSEHNSLVAVLEAQVEQLNQEIQRLRRQQQLTIELLQSSGFDRPARSMNKQQWVQLLESAGMSDEDMWQWHQEFESRMPEAHQGFLESLNMSDTEIKHIRKQSRHDKKFTGS